VPSVPIKKRKQREPVALPGGKRRLITEPELSARLGCGRRKTRELVSLKVIPRIDLGPRFGRYDPDVVDEVLRKIADGEIVVSELKNQKVSESA
jgi:hypothetical protein